MLFENGFDSSITGNWTAPARKSEIGRNNFVPAMQWPLIWQCHLAQSITSCVSNRTAVCLRFCEICQIAHRYRYILYKVDSWRPHKLDMIRMWLVSTRRLRSTKNRPHAVDIYQMRRHRKVVRHVKSISDSVSAIANALAHLQWRFNALAT